MALAPYPITSACGPVSIVACRSGHFCCYGTGALGLVPSYLTTATTRETGYDRTVFRENSVMARYTRSGVSVFGSNYIVARRLSSGILPNATELHLLTFTRGLNCGARRESCALSRLVGTSRVVIRSANSFYVPMGAISNGTMNKGTPRVLGGVRSTLITSFRTRYTTRWDLLGARWSGYTA